MLHQIVFFNQSACELESRLHSSQERAGFL